MQNKHLISQLDITDSQITFNFTERAHLRSTVLCSSREEREIQSASGDIATEMRQLAVIGKLDSYTR